MRFYLLISLFLSLVLPCITLSIDWQTELISTRSFSDALFEPIKNVELNAINTLTNPQAVDQGDSSSILFFNCVFALYLIGVAYKLFFFLKNLRSIIELIRKNEKVKEGNYWLITIEDELPAFSFLNFIFINPGYRNLNPEELQLIKDHESAHIQDFHTLDLLFMELIACVFWFNPLIKYLRKSLREIHEFIVDGKIAGEGENKKRYAQLLLSLATEMRGSEFATSFAAKPIERRLRMLVQPRASKLSRLKFSVLIPLATILLVTFSCNKKKNYQVSENVQTSANNKTIWSVQMDLQKYCGTYIVNEENSFLRPLDIRMQDFKLYKIIETTEAEYLTTRYKETDPKPTVRKIELTREEQNKFSYGYKNLFKIEFILDENQGVTACLFTQREGLGFVTYKLVKQN